MKQLSLLLSCSLFFISIFIDAQSPFTVGGKIGIEFSGFFEDVKVNAVGGCALNSKKRGSIIFGGMIQHDKGVHTPSFVCGLRPNLPSIYLDSTAIGIAFNQNQVHAAALPWPDEDFKKKSKIDSAIALAWSPLINQTLCNCYKQWGLLRKLIAQNKIDAEELKKIRLPTLLEKASRFVRMSEMQCLTDQEQHTIAALFYTRLNAEKTNCKNEQEKKLLEEMIDKVKVLLQSEDIK
jgi:hypothetical protein